MKKKCYSLLRWPAYYRMCSTGVLHCSKQTGGSSTKAITPSFLRFWNWAKKTVDAAKICGAKMLFKTETSKHS